MLEMECPKCGQAQIKWWPDDLVVVRNDRRRCPSCLVELELKNPGVCGLINSIIFGSITVGLTALGVGYGGARLVIASVLCWFLNPWIVRAFGRYELHGYTESGSVIARRWALVDSVSTWAFGIAAVLTIASFGIYYGNLLAELDYTIYGGGGAEPIDEFMLFLKTRMVVGVSVAVAALLVGLTAKVTKARLRTGAGR